MRAVIKGLWWRRGGREKSGPVDHDYKGITVQQKQIGELQWKQKRKFCFALSQQKTKLLVKMHETGFFGDFELPPFLTSVSRMITGMQIF